jgi:hypothetical protein
MLQQTPSLHAPDAHSQPALQVSPCDLRKIHVLPEQ